MGRGLGRAAGVTGEDYTVLEFDGLIFESAPPSMPEPVEPLAK